MTPIEEEKYKLRKAMEHDRGLLDERLRAEKSILACEHVFEHAIFTEIRQLDQLNLAEKVSKAPLTVCTYMPFRSELDITPIMEWCWQRGMRILAPRANRLKRSLHLHWVESYADLEAGAWGIREPKESAPSWDEKSPIDILFVPGLAFDDQGGRLGYGGGYYDRFVKHCQNIAASKPIKLAVAFDMQLVERVPMEDHDLTVDIIVTEEGIRKD